MVLALVPFTKSNLIDEDARQFGIQFRWWQPYHSSQGEDVWAIDEIIMTSVLFNSISLDFTNLLEKNATNCKTQLCCSFFLSVVFLAGVELARKTLWTRYRMVAEHGESSPGNPPKIAFSLEERMRYVETQSMQIGASYMIQFNLVMGCGQQYTPHMDNQVKLEYSTNHGLTWHLVQEECLPSMPSCQEFTPASIYHSSEYTKSSATRFRWSQCYYTSQDEWALDNIYIGQQCPNICDSGYQGTECHPENNLPSTIMSDFENPNSLEKEWQEVIGGEIVKPEQGCGVISSGSSLYFNKAGKRQLVSLDLDTTWVDFVQFYIQIGGESPSCNKPDSREEGVLLQYSNNGGINWHALAEMYFSDFSKSRFVYLELPPAAKTPCTRFRWWQPNFYEKPAFDYPMNQLSMWLMLANEGMPKNETFCSATPSAMIFGKSDGDRFAVTRDLVLKPGYVLQFKLGSSSSSVFPRCRLVLVAGEGGLLPSIPRSERVRREYQGIDGANHVLRRRF
ncbi:Reelin, partial [Ophiophagus hannah]